MVLSSIAERFKELLRASARLVRCKMLPLAALHVLLGFEPQAHVYQWAQQSMITQYAEIDAGFTDQ